MHNDTSAFKYFAGLHARVGKYGDTVYHGQHDLVGQIRLIPNKYWRGNHHPEFCLLVEQPPSIPTQPKFEAAPPESRRIPNVVPESWLEQEVREILEGMQINFTSQPSMQFDPDFLFSEFGAILYTDGCHWHGHQCPSGHRPDLRFQDRQVRDMAKREAAMAASWRLLTITRCAVSGPDSLPRVVVAEAILDFLTGPDRSRTIEGRAPLGTQIGQN